MERIALITQADQRNVVLFPEKFDGRFVRLDRPHTENNPWSIWISYSPDLIHWGDSKVIVKPEAYHWDEMKIGPGATPFKTDKGWLQIYHGVFRTMDGAVYRLGAILHDQNDPSLILGNWQRLAADLSWRLSHHGRLCLQTRRNSTWPEWPFPDSRGGRRMDSWAWRPLGGNWICA